MKCLNCEKGNLVKKKIDEEMFGIHLGRFPVDVCDACGESFVNEEVMEKIEKRAKELGVWGLSKKSKVVKSGNSLVVRIPAEIARFLGISAGNDVLFHPEGKKKLVFEVT